MTVREFLQNNNISLDSEMYVRITTYDECNNDYCQDFPITSITLEGDNISLESTYLNQYESDWLM